MSINNSALAEMADEILFDSATLTSGYDLAGSLDQAPVVIIFDNQSTVPIGVSNNGTSIWKTFPAGEALVLDLRANHGRAENYAFRKNMSLYLIGASGTGNFSISYIYAGL